MNEEDITNELKLDITGNAILLIESDWGPIEFKIEDKDITLQLMKIVIDNAPNNFNVDSFSDEDEQAMRKLLRR